MAEKKKILYIVEAMGGGVFTYIVDLANELVNKYDMYIAYAVRKQTPKNYKDYFDKRIHLIEVKNFGRAINPTKDIAAFFEVKKIAAEVKPDVIHLHSSKAGAIGRIAFDGKIPMFYTPHKVPIGCYCKMFKREVLKTTRFIPEVFIGEGFNFNVAAFQKSNRILAGKLKTYFYRRDNPTSAMTKFSIKKCECGLKALDIIKENLQIHTDRVQTAWEFADWRTHSDFYDAMVLAKVKNE